MSSLDHRVDSHKHWAYLPSHSVVVVVPLVPHSSGDIKSTMHSPGNNMQLLIYGTLSADVRSSLLSSTVAYREYASVVIIVHSRWAAYASYLAGTIPVAS